MTPRHCNFYGRIGEVVQILVIIVVGSVTMKSAWVVERRQASSAKRQASTIGDDSHRHELSKLVDDARATLQKRDVSCLRKELADARRAATQMTKRWQIRNRKDLDEKIFQREDQIRNIESGKDDEEFKHKAKAYEDAHNALITDAKRTRTRANHVQSSKLAAISSTIRDEFISEVMGQPPPLYLYRGDVCEDCGVPMVVLTTDALLACPQCSRTRIYINATSARVSYGDVEFASFPYKRQNHFQEWLKCFQAKETTRVPDDVVNEVMEELYRRRLTNTQDITPDKVREILKFLNRRKYYENKTQIACRITGRAPPRMTPAEEEQCRLMDPWRKHCPPDRTNFLSYSYCLFKFCELLGWTQYTKCFSLLKGREKLQKQNDMFRMICHELDWDFFESPCR